MSTRGVRCPPKTVGILAAGFVISLTVMSCAHAFGKQSTVELQDQAITVEAAVITHFEKAQPERTQFGKLEWRGGLILSSASSFFGGWSGLAVDRDGGRMLAVSDTGVWLTGRFTYDGTRPAGIADARLGALRGADGLPFKRGFDRDAEGVALIEGTLMRGEVLVSFEQNHRILRYPVTAAGVGVPTASLRLPLEALQLEPNKSLEAVCKVQAGPAKDSILTFAERFPLKGRYGSGWIRPPLSDQTKVETGKEWMAWNALTVEVQDGYDFTDCAGLPNGDVLLLERRYRVNYGDPLTGPRLRIRRFTSAELPRRQGGGADALREAVPIRGETLLDVGADTHEIDNMEGLDVHTDAKGAVVLTLISDDNFNAYLQRNVLLQFALQEPVPPSQSAKEQK